MRFVFNSKSWAEYLYWQKADKRILKKINELLRDVSRDPYRGPGKPEALKHDLAGYWSRRIDQEHRLVYRISGDEIHVISCRYHYTGP